MSQTTPLGGPPPHFIVFVPGFMGSKLRDRTTGQTVWVDFTQVPLNPLQWDGWLDHLFTAMQFPNENLEASGVIDNVVFAKPWIKQEQYSRLLLELESLGYTADPTQHAEKDLNVYMFPYDWRQDNRVSAQQLKAAIERWSTFHPGAQVWLMAHSNGGLVARWYIEKEGGKDRVGRLILLASPWDGTAKAMHMLFSGLDMLFRLQFNLFQIPQRTRAALRTFPSIFQLLPQQNPFLRDANNNVVNLWTGQNWLQGPQEQGLLADASQFHQDLGTHLSVETLVFFGRQQPTTTSGIVTLSAGSHWDSIQWLDTLAGDGTLPESTAVFAEARQNIPVIAGHGDIYVNPALFEILRWELVDKYRGIQRASLTTEGLAVEFNPERDVYQPGEPIKLWATVHNTLNHAPVTNATVHAQLIYRERLPGSSVTTPPHTLPDTRLAANHAVPGRYEGTVKAPAIEGYYEIRAFVSTGPGNPIQLSELIAVEARAAVK